MKNKKDRLFFEDTESGIGGGYPSRGVKGFTIPLPTRAANYGEAVKLVPSDVTVSSACESHVRVPDCTDTVPLFRLPGEGVSQHLDRVLEALNESDNRGQHPASHPNPYAVLEGVDMDGCTKNAWLLKRAKTLVKWYRRLGLPQIGDLPESLECGGLRPAVRKCFSHLDERWELSFKTIQKVEKDCCENCLPRFSKLLSQWKTQRCQPVEVSELHLVSFRDMLRRNIDKGWDRGRRPFIPNGNATESYRRRDGGNWNIEEFSDSCRVELVFSSGKPRVVTLYSSENTRILAPLHYSLHDRLQRKGWLLVGDPTDKDIGKLTGTKYLSFDYQSATDNIKTAYVKAAVDVLIDQADLLTEDEIRALRVMSELKFEGQDGVTTRGQPMGSVMSFPLLCLINKTVVDLALTDLLKRKEISFREWSGHPCLVNGDDLLLREPRSGTDLRAEICRHGNEVGLVVNTEKSMVDDQKAEVNSTLFQSGCLVKKLNVSSLWMKPDVTDVLGVASQSSIDGKTFVKIVRANAHILSKQEDKMLYDLPRSLQRLCRKDKKIRRAITSSPTTKRPVDVGVIEMAERPFGYDLTREEEYKTMTEEIDRVREMGIAKASTKRPSFRTSFEPACRSYSSATRRPVTTERELIPKCYARRFALKQWEGLESEQLLAEPPLYTAVFDGSMVNHLVDIIRARSFAAVPHPGTTLPLGSFVSVAV